MCTGHLGASRFFQEHIFQWTCAGKLKQECTVLVVSHDLRELEPLIDVAWEMEPGGKLNPVQWPPTKA